MKTSILKLGLLSLIAAAVAAMPMAVHAQARTFYKFQGKLTAVDATAKTITVGNNGLTLQITSESKIFKGKQPATLEDAAVGASVSGSYKQGADKKNSVHTLNIAGEVKAADAKP